MERVIKVMEEDVKYNHLPIFRRVGNFFWQKKGRFIVLGLIFAGYQYWGSPLAMFGAWVERTYKKYKKRWIYRYNPHCVAYQTAMDTIWEPEKLSR